MQQTWMGFNYLGEWPQWNAANNQREDEGGTARAADDTESQTHPRSPLEAAGKPTEGVVWPAPTKSEHVEPSSLKKQHAKAFRLSKVRPFVLYSLRHTFLTRLGQSGCDVWTLARIAGHSSIVMSARYVHPSEDAVLDAMVRLGGHKNGHSAKAAPRKKNREPHLNA